MTAFSTIDMSASPDLTPASMENGTMDTFVMDDSNSPKQDSVFNSK